MRVAVVTDYFPDSAHPWNGHSAYQTLRLLARMCEVHVFFAEAVYPAPLTPKRAQVQPLDRTWSPPDVQATYIPFPVVPIVSRPLNGYTSAMRLLPKVRAWKPDIILNYAVYPYGLAAVRIAQSLGVPTVLTAIGSDLNRIADPICGMLTRWTLRHASFVTTVSRDLAKTAVRLGSNPARTQAILNGCNTAVFHPQNRLAARNHLGLDPEAEIVVYVGRLDVRKGLVELVEAAAALHASRPKAQCVLIGSGPADSVLREAIASANATEFIHLVPPCVTEQIAIWMGASDLVTLPSYMEGCPNVVIEALCAGRPMVATSVGGIPELIDDQCGRLIPVRDVPALTEALSEVLSIGWSAEDIAAQHTRSWSNVADDLFTVLQQTVRPLR
jgi:glycosyltransferase involved in cell wall biosynthesis